MVHALKLLKMKLVLLLVVAVVMKCFVPWFQSARNQRKESPMRSNRGRYIKVGVLKSMLEKIKKAIYNMVNNMEIK